MDMMREREHRNGETGLLPFRTRRVFNVGNDWFFAVRSENDQGPFDNQVSAEYELNAFLLNSRIETQKIEKH